MSRHIGIGRAEYGRSWVVGINAVWPAAAARAARLCPFRNGHDPCARAEGSPPAADQRWQDGDGPGVGGHTAVSTCRRRVRRRWWRPSPGRCSRWKPPVRVLSRAARVGHGSVAPADLRQTIKGQPRPIATQTRRASTLGRRHPSQWRSGPSVRLLGTSTTLHRMLHGGIGR